jgi:hypothetical protein
LIKTYIVLIIVVSLVVCRTIPKGIWANWICFYRIVAAIERDDIRYCRSVHEPITVARPLTFADLSATICVYYMEVIFRVVPVSVRNRTVATMGRTRVLATAEETRPRADR